MIPENVNFSYVILTAVQNDHLSVYTLLRILKENYERIMFAKAIPVAALMRGSWVRIPPGAWMSVSVECCVLSGRGLCDELITRTEESYRLCMYLMVCELKTSTMRRPRPELGCCVTGKEKCLPKGGVSVKVVHKN
jgi:hypothetical protein